MFETHANYEKFAQVTKGILEEKGRCNLVNLVKQPRISDLFLHNVDHPTGYQDGPSGISLNAMKDRALPLSEKDRRKLYEIAEHSIRSVEEGVNELGSDEKRDLLLGANQLIQNADWRYWHGNGGWRGRKGNKQLERIAKLYTEDDSIARVREWDAQIAENQGFYHIDKGMSFGSANSMVGMFGLIPTSIAALTLFGPEAMEYTTLPLFLGGASAIFANNLLLIPQEVFGEENSPNTSSKLVTGRQYKFLRHPLYASRMLGDVLFGLASFPFGTYFCAKGLYHNAKGCEKQDERMRILHGNEAIKYQSKTPAFIPGTKLLMRGLRKILPEKVCDNLDTPISHYLEQIPGIKDENYWTDDLVTSPSYHKGEPTYHIGTSEERKAGQENF